MLLKITESCSMGCTHCVSDCKPDDKKHMTQDTFKQALKFIKYYSPYFSTLVVSGGEPFEHPELDNFLGQIAQMNMNVVHSIIVNTNGLWICQHFDEFKRLYEKYSYQICKNIIMWQITTDKRYYPISIEDKYPEAVKEIESLSQCYIERNIQYIYPQGRADENNLEWTSNAPKCFNVRSIASSVETFEQVIAHLTMHNIMCCPTIEYNGDLKVGESQLCPMVSNIWKSDKEIMEDIRSFKCLSCSKPISKLPKEAINILK